MNEVTLDCGHVQQVTEFRIRTAAAGNNQHPVWCVACNNWSLLSPFKDLRDEETQEEFVKFIKEKE